LVASRKASLAVRVTSNQGRCSSNSTFYTVLLLFCRLILSWNAVQACCHTTFRLTLTSYANITVSRSCEIGGRSSNSTRHTLGYSFLASVASRCAGQTERLSYFWLRKASWKEQNSADDDVTMTMTVMWCTRRRKVTRSEKEI
jgi:hypothetical protein